MVFLDTNIVVWLYSGELRLLTDRVRKVIEESSLMISPVVALELEYLHEIKRVTRRSREVLKALGRDIGLQKDDIALDDVVTQALGQKWTRDPFDRLIVSHARIRRAPLLTRDKTILKNYSQAIWD